MLLSLVCPEGRRTSGAPSGAAGARLPATSVDETALVAGLAVRTTTATDVTSRARRATMFRWNENTCQAMMHSSEGSFCCLAW